MEWWARRDAPLPTLRALAFISLAGAQAVAYINAMTLSTGAAHATDRHPSSHRDFRAPAR